MIYVVVLAIVLVPLLLGSCAILYNKTAILPKRNFTDVFFQTLLFHSVYTKTSYGQSHITVSNFDKVLRYLHQNNFHSICASEIPVHSTKKASSLKKNIVLLFDDGFENFYYNAFPLLEKYQLKASIFPVVQSISGHSSWDIYPVKKHLSKNQIHEISEAGHEIGSHTLSHPDLVLLPEKQIRYELDESKKILQDIVGKPIVSISFPFGSWNYRVWNIAREIGYTQAIVYRHLVFTDIHIIPAIGVYALDSYQDILEKIVHTSMFSPVHSRDIIMPHFAKGTALWNYRKTYNIFNYFT